MPKAKDPQLYEQARNEADKVYKKPSAYKSGFIVKKYKELYKTKYGSGEAYLDDKKPKNLKRWFMESWADVGEGPYPLYRPTRRISSATPKTEQEIPLKRIKEQDKLKQKIKGSKNLPKF